VEIKRGKKMKKKINKLIIPKRIIFSLIFIVLLATITYSANLVYNFYSSYSTQDMFFTNGTEYSSLGARDSAPVLFMDFNKAPESLLTAYNCSTSTGCQGIYTLDNSINNNHGTSSGYLNESAWHNQGAQVNNSLQFDAVGNYGRRTNRIATGQNITISVWVNMRGNGGAYSAPNYYGWVVAQNSHNTNASREWSLITTNNNTIGFDLYYNGNSTTSQSAYLLTSVTPNTWTHYLMTADNSTGNFSIYKNGALVNSTSFSGTINTGSGNFLIGLQGWGGASNFFYNGSMDEIMIFNRTLSQTEITNLYGNQSAGSRILDTDANLISYWKMDELTGTNLLDSKGTNNLTIYNYPATTTPFWNETGGNDGNGAYTFDGTNDLLTFPAISLGTVHSASAWVKLNNVSVGQSIISSTSIAPYVMAFDNTLIYYHDGGTSTSTSYRVGDNTWRFITVVRNNQNITFYSNGVYLDSKLLTSNNAVTVASLGASSRIINGTVDNVQIFNRALSAQEVLSLYNGTLANKSLKYSSQNGDFTSGVFYNSTQTYWNLTLSTADTYSTRSGLVNPDNSINTSNPNLRAYFPLNGTYTELTGQINTTSLVGLAAGGLNNATGISDNAIRFDGTDDYLSTNMTATGWRNLSECAWVRDTEGLTYNGVFNSRPNDGASRNTWGITMEGNTYTGALFTVINGTQACTVRPFNAGRNVAPTGQWFHICGTWEGYTGTCRLYINGVLVDNQTNAQTQYVVQETVPLIGYDRVSGQNRYFNGTLNNILVYNSTLSASDVQQLYKSGLSQKANTNITVQTRTANNYNLTDVNLVALLGMNGDTSLGETNTTIVDSSGKYNATCSPYFTNSSNRCPYPTPSGVVGNGLNFSTGASQERITLNWGPNINLTTTPITTCLWAKPDSTNAALDILLDSGTSASNKRYYLAAGDGTNSKWYACMGASGGCILSASALTTTWTHVCIAPNSTSNRLFINGVQENSATFTSYILDLNYTIGSAVGGGSDYAGSIDDLRIYNRSLSASEILDLYNLGSTHISDWSSWSSAVTAQDNSNVTPTNSGKFMQYKAFFNSNTTNQSPYLLSYNLSMFPDIFSSNISSSTPNNASLTSSNLTNGVNFTANMTDDLAGLKNATLNIYNSSNILVNQTSINVSQSTGVLQTTVGIVVTLIDGVYSWFWNIFDWNGNTYSSQNKTLTVDNTAPNATLLNPENSFVLNSTTQDAAFSSIGIGNFSIAGSTSATTNSSISGFFNQTESNSSNLRLTASVLSMDFNSPAELNNPAYGEPNYQKDNSVYNNFGTIGDFNATYMTGKVGYALSGDGSNDQGSNTLVGSVMNGTNNYSISVWYKGTQAGGVTRYYLFGVSDGANNEAGVSIYAASSTANFLTYSPSSYGEVNSGITINDNIWHHVLVTKSGTNGSIYVDGVYKGSGTVKQPTLTSATGYILARPGIGSTKGTIDELMLFNRTLTQAEVTSIYNNQSAGVRSSGLETDPSLVSYWYLDTTNISGTNYTGSATLDSKGLYNFSLSGYPTSNTRPTYNATGGNDGSGAYTFDGVDDYISQASPLSSYGGPWTISAWAKTNSSYASARGIIYAMSVGSGVQAGMNIYTGKLQLSLGSNRYFTATCSQSPTNNNWHHLVVQGMTTADQTSTTGLTAYLDGVACSIAYDAQGSSVTAGSAFFGSYTSAAGFFNGSIDQVQVFNRVLTAGEVLALYNGTSNNSNYIGKYSKSGDFTSGVFYNSTQTYWNLTLSTADTYSTRSGLVNADNSINTSNANLVSYWKLDGNYLDATGRKNGSSQEVINNATGISSNAMRFDGANDYINISSSESDFKNMPMTISIWAKSDKVSQGNYIALLSKYEGASSNGWSIDSSAGAYYFYYLKDGSNKIYAGTYGVPFGTATTDWTHLVAVINSSGGYTYNNGVLVSSQSWTGTAQNTTSAVPLMIGRISKTTGTAQAFNGSLNEITIYNTSLTSSQVQQLYKSGLSQKANTNVTVQTRTANTYNTTDASLVGFWAFNNVSGESATYFKDELGRLNGSCLGTCPTFNSSGVVGNSLAFSTGGVNLSNNTAFNLSTFTFVAWANPTTRSTVNHIAAKSTGLTNGWQLGIDDASGLLCSAGGSKAFFQFLGGSGVLCSTTSIPTNQWTFYTITYNGSYQSMYINGVLERGSAATQLYNTRNFTIGTREDNTWPWKGYIDEVRLYNRSLSASEILDLYNLGSTHITDWSNWSSEKINSDGSQNLINSAGKFVQFKTNLYTNTTNSSPYLISYNITSLGNIGNIKNLTINMTDNIGGIANATLVVVNASNQSQQIGNSTVSLNNPLTATIGIAVSLIDGLYNWFYRIFDLAGNLFTTENRTLIVDSVAPSIILNTPADNFYTNSNPINFTANVSDAVQVANATIYLYNSTELNYSETLSGINRPSATIGIPLTINQDGNYTWNYSVMDSAGITNSSLTSRTIIIDTTLPVSVFTSPTPNNDSGSNVAITISANITEINPANATLYWKNGTGNILTSTSNAFTNIGTNVWQINFTNQTPLLAGQFYFYNISVTDLAGNTNSTETRLVKGNTAPRMLINTGTTENGYYNSSEIFANFSVTDNEGNMNYSEVTLYYKPNWTADLVLRNQTNSTETSSEIFEINYTDLEEGIYYLNGSATDLVGELNYTTTRTIILDRTNSSVLNLINNNTNLSYTNVNFTVNLSDNLGVANATLNIFNSSNVLINQTSINFLEGTIQTSIGIVVTLVDGVYSWFWNIFDWAGNIASTENQTLTTDTIVPYLYNILYSPDTNDTIDPQTLMQFNVSVRDLGSGVENTTLEIFNGTEWANYSMSLISGEDFRNGIWTADFNTSSIETNYAFRIFAVDYAGNSVESANFTFPSFWDCTWTATNSLGGSVGYSENKWVGYLIVNNTGDSNYTDGCTLTFKSQHNLDSGKIYLNTASKSTVYSLTPNSIKNISVNYTFGQDMKSELYTITTTETSEVTSTSQRNTTGTAVTNQQGPYLYQSASSSSTLVYIKPQTITLSASISNLMGSDVYNETNTAFNVTSNWTISNSFVNVSGNLTNMFENMSDSNENSLSLDLNASNWSTFTQGIYYFNLSSEGKDYLGSPIKDTENNSIFVNSLSLSFLCYPLADGFDAKGCWPLDPDTIYCGNGHIDANETCSSCSQDAGSCTTTNVGGNTGGSGGGGGGGGVAGNLYEKSEATYELVSGQEQEFVLPIQNKLPSEKRSISVKVSGLNSEYIQVSPTFIDSIPSNSVKNIVVKITAPAYFTQGKYLLKFDLNGDLVSNGTTKFSETKYVTLYILEISRTEAERMMNESMKFIEEMNSSGLKTSAVIGYFSLMNDSYNEVNFLQLKENYESLKELYTSAIESQKIITELKDSIADAEKRGIDVTDTKKLLFAAETIFERGDYLLALSKLKEAKLSYALQVKGEFNIFYEIKNNPVQSMFIALIVSFAGVSSSLLVRYQLLKTKRNLLKEEEKLLLQLMKVVQRDCFERNKLSMEEYNESMSQYERRLSEVIQEGIRTETQIYNLLKIRGKLNALKQEKSRIISMIKDLQESYLKKGTIETRVYENMLKSYTSRLSKVEEELVFIETKELLSNKK
jgi:hypothetical protein